METGNYSQTQKAFDDEALNPDGIFNKSLTECDRLSIEFLKGYAQDWMQVLEIGCGKGNVIEALAGNKTAVDLSPEMLKECAIKNKQVANMDALPFDDESFDLTYMIMTFQHSKDREKTLSEMNRVTKEGGWMVIIDGDKDSGIGKIREQGVEAGTWPRVGDAHWIYREDFPEWEAKHLAEHILCLFKKK